MKNRKSFFSIKIILFLSLFLNIYNEDIIDIIQLDSETDFRAAIKKQNNLGGSIYINTSVINIKTDLTLELKGEIPGGIIGIKQKNGEYPRINFENVRNIGAFYTLNVYGSNKYLKYLIFENSPVHGIKVSGKNHYFDHIITRYNQYSGIYISNAADSNIFNHCYSYRNCDIKGNGLNGDGFYSYGATNNVFKYCYSWDNSNNGFSVSNHELESSSMSFSHSACWNNGNSDIFSGKYDYDNGNLLDKNMLTIQQLINSDKNYENNYNKKKFNYENGKIDGKNANEWISLTNQRSKGNGFQFGFAYSPAPSTIQRMAELSVAFDHKSKGFDNNYSKKYQGYITNCASFNNKINYQLPYTFAKWDNNWGWGAKEADQKEMEQIINKPNKTGAAQSLFYSVRNQIIQAVYSNTFPDNINFDSSIKSLNLN